MHTEANEISWYFKVINNMIRRRINESLKSEDLTKVQFEVMLFLYQSEQSNQTVIQRDLENHFRISNPSVSNLISRLELKELVERTPDECDRRRRAVVLSSKGQKLLDSTHREIHAFESAMLEGFSKEELDEGLQFLRRILKNLTDKEEYTFDFNTCQTDQTV